MKTLSRLAVATLILLSFAVPAAQAQVSVSTSVFFGSPYVWRGQVLSTGWVFQPTISASYGGLSATYFGNIDPNSSYLSEEKVHLQESDLTLAYAASLPGVDFALGYTFYTFPTPGDELELLPTQEVFGSVSLSSLPVVPSLFVAYDFDENETNNLQGLYGEAKLGYELNAGGQAYALGAALGLDSGYYQKYYAAIDPTVGDDETSLSHAALSASTTFEAGSISISPMAAFQASIDDTYKALFGDTFFYGGITVGF
jgi:hypothetical protein